MAGHIYTIPSHKPFIESLMRGLLRRITYLGKKTGQDVPSLMARSRIYVPTRRAATKLREVFDAYARQGHRHLLPHIAALGNIDEDPFYSEDFSEQSTDTSSSAGWEDSDIPPSIDGLERQAHLTRLILDNDIPVSSVAMAWRLGREIARLFDMLQIEDKDVEDLEQLSLDDHSAQWQKILELLIPIRREWRILLKDQGRCDLVERHALLLERQSLIWQEKNRQGVPHNDIVIVAGTTGSRPATIRFIQTVLDLPMGAIVLPGFDTAMPESDRSLLNGFHHQYVMNRLLQTLKLPRIRIWHDGQHQTDYAFKKRRITRIRKALAPLPEPPSPTKDRPGNSEHAIRLFSLQDQGEEAAVIASLLRQSCEDEAKISSAALVTADRSLARRVVSQLRRWNLDIADSADTPLNVAPAMIFLKLLIQAVKSQWAPLDFLALLRHPYSRIGITHDDVLQRCAHIEAWALRGTRPEAKIAGILQGIERYVSRHSDGTLADKEKQLLEKLEAITGTLETRIHAADPVEASLILDIHYRTALELAEGPDGDNPLRQDGGARSVKLFFERAMESARHLPKLRASDYPEMLDEMVRAQTFTASNHPHPRLFIWGLLEARLQSVDRVILGGLNEDSWPRSSHHDIWLNRSLCSELGISPPEWRIGASCHDFVQAFSARDVILTRSRHKRSQPTHPARWLVRMQHLLEDEDMAEQDDAQAKALILDAHARPVQPIAPPAPKPPIRARKKFFYVSHIEELMRDPYVHYARHILKLRPRSSIDEEPDQRHFGSVIHKILADFIAQHPLSLPDRAIDILNALVKENLKGFHPPNLRAHWQERMGHILHRFYLWEKERRAQDHLFPIATEINGSWKHPTQGWSLHARADRIDQDADHQATIMDYKTGKPPSASQVEKGLYPQLLIQGLIFSKNGYEGMKGSTLKQIHYRHLTTVKDGFFTSIYPQKEKTDRYFAADIIENTDVMKKLEIFIERYLDSTTPLLARPRPALHADLQIRANMYDPFDHLSRIQEWNFQA